MDKMKRNHEVAFLVFMVLVAALGNQNPSFEQPHVLWSFLGLLVFNLLNLALGERALSKEASAALSVLANSAFIALILRYSGGADSYLWVLCLLPIFTAGLFLERRAGYATIALEAVMLAVFYAGYLDLDGWLSLLEWASKAATLLVCGAVTMTAVQGEQAAKRALGEEHARIEREKRELSQRLQHADRLATVGTLVASIVHDVNNPLTTIVALAQMRQGAPGTPPDIAEDLGTVAAAGLRCRDILADLLSFSRRQARAPEACDVNAILRQCVNFKKHDWVLEKITAVEDLAEGLPEVRLVASQFQQVVFNLLVNAQQAIHSSKEGGKVWVRTQEVGACVRVTVEDDGPGIPREIAGRIFEPFFTTKPDGVGTGLGLSISRQLIEDLGGSLAVRSSPGRGASFIMEFPVEAGRSGARVAEPLLAAQAARDAAEPAGRTRR